MKLVAAIALATTLTCAGHVQAQTLPPLADDLRPMRTTGVGLHVKDIERSKRFYMEVLGYKVAGRLPPTGPLDEYLLGLTGNTLTDTLIILRQVDAPIDATKFGKVVLTVPNARALAERAARAGYPPERVVDGVNFIKDPDGYTIELYQRPQASGASH